MIKELLELADFLYALLLAVLVAQPFLVAHRRRRLGLNGNLKFMHALGVLFASWFVGFVYTRILPTFEIPWTLCTEALLVVRVIMITVVGSTMYVLFLKDGNHE